MLNIQYHKLLQIYKFRSPIRCIILNSVLIHSIYSRKDKLRSQIFLTSDIGTCKNNILITLINKISQQNLEFMINWVSPLSLRGLKVLLIDLQIIQEDQRKYEKRKARLCESSPQEAKTGKIIISYIKLILNEQETFYSKSQYLSDIGTINSFIS